MKKIVILCGETKSSHYVYNALKEVCSIEAVICEKPVSRKILIKRRLEKFGYAKVINQLLFQSVCAPVLKWSSKKRREEVEANYSMSTQPFDSDITYQVGSVNNEECYNLLRGLNPDLVIVNGTRIISKKILSSITGKFLNTHVGITPKYRGVHGGYWAIVNNDLPNCGVTIHWVDTGVDTGRIINQQAINITDRDNFATYPVIQYGVACTMLKKVVQSYINEREIEEQQLPSDGVSKMWYHPSFTFYLYNRIFKGVK